MIWKRSNTAAAETAKETAKPPALEKLLPEKPVPQKPLFDPTAPENDRFAHSQAQPNGASRLNVKPIGAAAPNLPPMGGAPKAAANGNTNGNNGAPPSAPGAKQDPASSSPFRHEPPEGHAKKVSEVLGELVWLMSQSPMHKQFFISDLEWFIMTPVLLQQFRTFYATDRPIGVLPEASEKNVLWASVSDEVAERLAQGTTKLRPQDWKSGDKLWVVESLPRTRRRRRRNRSGVIAPFDRADASGHPKRQQKSAEEMVKDLKEKVFPMRAINFLAVKDGKKDVRSL